MLADFRSNSTKVSDEDMSNAVGICVEAECLLRRRGKRNDEKSEVTNNRKKEATKYKL